MRKKDNMVRFWCIKLIFTGFVINTESIYGIFVL